jgi:hypothetical protein
MRVAPNPEQTTGTSKVVHKAKKKAPDETDEAAKPQGDKVTLSPKAKSTATQVPTAVAVPTSGPSEKDLKQTEILMDHVNSGKLSDEEQDLAMKKVAEFLRKYGTA